MSFKSFRQSDPRYLQLIVQGTLLVYAKFNLTFFPDWSHIALIGVSAVCLQFLACTVFQVRFDPKSTIASSMSVALLCRFSGIEPILWAVFFIVMSKFLFRSGDKHIFNPSNLAVVAVPFMFPDSAWIGGGQWGSGLIFAFLLACIGITIVTGAKRWDISFATIGIWASMVFARALLYGDPLEIPFHALTNGSVILFCFFMISDPKTTPDTFRGRMAYALGTCCVAAVVQFVFYKPHGLFYGLFVMSALYPFVSFLREGDAYLWPSQAALSEKLGES